MATVSKRKKCLIVNVHSYLFCLLYYIICSYYIFYSNPLLHNLRSSRSLLISAISRSFLNIYHFLRLGSFTSCSLRDI